MKEKVDLSSFSNPEYDPGRNVLTRGLWYACNALIFKSYLFPFYRLKWFLLKVFGAKIGNGLIVKPGVSFKYPWKLEIGNHVWIGEGAWIDNLDQVVIGDNVCISQGAMLLCGNHDYKKPSFDLITAPIIIEAGAWIGAKSIVCPGVQVGEQAVLTVGSVATSSLLPNKIYQGNPASPIKDRKLHH